MINIKNNKLLSAKKVPFFINPNSIAADVVAAAAKLQLQPLEIATKEQVSNSSGAATTSSVASFASNKVTSTSLPVASLRNATSSSLRCCHAIVAFAKPKPKLVFLHKKGSQIPNPSIISYNFPGTSSQPKLAPNNVYNLLFNFFKSMYGLISKPVFITTPDKIKIQLFYFLCIPKFLINRTVIAAAASSGNFVTSCSEAAATTAFAANEITATSVAKANEITASLASLASLATKGTSFSKLGKPSQALGFNSKDLNVKVNLKRLTQSNLTEVYPQKFKLICTILSKFFNKNVELELIRLHQPYYNSNILVNFLALIINKKNIGACIQRLYNSNIIKANKASSLLAAAKLPLQDASIDASHSKAVTIIASQLSGLNIKISGRLMREPIIPRITTKKFEKGFTAKGKINYFDLARFTHKNRKGAFTITVKAGQNF